MRAVDNRWLLQVYINRVHTIRNSMANRDEEVGLAACFFQGQLKYYKAIFINMILYSLKQAQEVCDYGVAASY